MIQKNEIQQIKELTKGLVTRSDFLRGDISTSPDCMDIKWDFDSSIHKRLGSSTTNSVTMANEGNFASWILDQNASLSANLLYYWTLNEGSSPLLDSSGTNNLLTVGSFTSVTGLRSNAAQLGSTGYLVTSNNALINLDTATFSISEWIYVDTFGGGNYTVFQAGSFGSPGLQAFISPGGSQITLSAVSNGTQIASVTGGAVLNTGTWINIIAWRSNGSHIGLSINNTVTTANLTGAIGGPVSVNSGNFLRFGFDQRTPMRVDEVGFWNKILSTQERSDLYGGGSGNTYSTGTSNLNSWASFDFGATSIRWLTVSVSTGIVASSNRGASFVTIATSRTQTYQSLNRSKNVLIATSDARDPVLYWAGSAGTFAQTLAPNSAPQVKYSVNNNGFLILLNGIGRPRGFFYADENLQLTDSWTNTFDLPSSDDDEITSNFVLNRILYVSTRYRIFRLSFVGGNPDWKYEKVKDFGFVPRTVKIVSLKEGTVAIGLDWTKRLRIFTGTDDLFISDNIENDNRMCEFAMNKISQAGSGLLTAFAENDIVNQEYRLAVAIGLNSTSVTHHIVLNNRTLSFYPYSNQLFTTMCMAESNQIPYLMAMDRSGYCHILNSGNLDSGVTPINEHYDSPIFYNKSPEVVSKLSQLNLYFGVDSAGTVFYQDRVDFANYYSPTQRIKELLGTESSIQVLRTINVPSVNNTYQFRLTSSAGTANPWELNRIDLVSKSLGIGLNQG